MRATWRRVFQEVARGFECELCMQWRPAHSRAMVRHCPEGGGACGHPMCDDCIARIPISFVRRFKGRVHCVTSCPWCRIPTVTLVGRDRTKKLHGSVMDFLYHRCIKMDILCEIINGDVSVVEGEEETEVSIHGVHEEEISIVQAEANRNTDAPAAHR
jgi:hypothetical protein